MSILDPQIEVVLRSRSWGSDESTEITARFRPGGALEIEYYTAGASVASDTGDSDYEHFTVVEPQHVDQVLEQLMAEFIQLPLMRPGALQRNVLTLLYERFRADPIPSSSIERWLSAHRIPYSTATM